MKMTCKWCLLVIGMILCFGELKVIAEGEVNLFPNGDFEKSDLGEGIPEGWKRGPFKRPPSIFVVQETYPDSTGKKCVKFENQEEKPRNEAIYSELIPIDPKIPLHLSLWYKTEGMVENKYGVYISVAWYDQGHSPILIGSTQKMEYVNLNNGHPEDWKEFKQVMHPKDENYIAEKMGWLFIPPEAAFLEIRLTTINYPRRIWVDDIVVVQKPL